MKKIRLFVVTTAFAAGLGVGVPGASAADSDASDQVVKTLYDFTVKTISGNDQPLAKYKGDVCLVVNVASK